MARLYNVRPYNCGKYQADLWDSACDDPETWIPGQECPGGDWSEDTPCTPAYLLGDKPTNDWAELGKPSNTWIKEDC